MTRIIFYTISLIALFFPTHEIFAQQTNADRSHIHFLNANGVIQQTLFPFAQSDRGGGSLITHDLGSDGIEEIIVGSGPGFAPYVSLYRQDGTKIREFLAYSEHFLGGVDVAVGDVDGDGEKEIITGAGYGGGPHVRVFSSYGELKAQFFAYQHDFRGGVHVAVGDVTGDGIAEIITGAGITGGPHVKLFSDSGEMMYEFFIGGAGEPTGVDVAVADLNGNGDVEILAGRAGYSHSRVEAYDWKDGHVQYVLGLDAFENNHAGVHVFSGDVDGDGMDEIGVGTKSGEATVRFFEMTGALRWEARPFDAMQSAQAAVIGGESARILVMGSEPMTSQRAGQHIYVDLDRQILRAYENGALVRAFLISGGLSHYPSPIGEYQIFKKDLWKDYTWYFGQGDTRNYDLSNVQYNLKFKPLYYIHYAYWHTNFGTPMSHGCINTAYDDAQWIYTWANIGATIVLED